MFHRKHVNLIEIMDFIYRETPKIFSNMMGKRSGQIMKHLEKQWGIPNTNCLQSSWDVLGKYKHETLEFTIWLCQNSYGNSPFLIGKPSVNGPFSKAFCMFTRGYHQRNRIIKQKCHITWSCLRNLRNFRNTKNNMLKNKSSNGFPIGNIIIPCNPIFSH